MKPQKDPKPHFYPHKPLKNVTPLFSFHRIKELSNIDGMSV